MRLNKIFLMASLILLSVSSSFADVSVPYGEGAGKVDFLNSNKYPNYNEQEETLPIGPMSFRIIDNKIWVADTVGGKLLQFDDKGKLISEFSILPTGIKPYQKDEDEFPLSNILIEDMAPVMGEYGAIKAWWIADSTTNKLIKFSADGKPLALLSDPGFGQLMRVEVGPSGHLFAADNVNNKIYIYDSEGNMTSEQNWEDSGMAVAGKDDYLYRLIYFNEEKKYMLVTTDVKGKVIKSKALDVEMYEPELWWVDDIKQEAVITYSSKPVSEENSEKEGLEDEDLEKEELEKEDQDDIKAAELNSIKSPNEDFEIIRVGFDGKVKAKGKISAPILMNRFIEHSNYEDVFIGKCNYFEAPKGNFEIVPFKMP